MGISALAGLIRATCLTCEVSGSGKAVCIHKPVDSVVVQVCHFQYDCLHCQVTGMALKGAEFGIVGSPGSDTGKALDLCSVLESPHCSAAGTASSPMFVTPEFGTFEVPALQTPPKFHEKTPRERRKNEISGGREQKKREILGPPPFGPPPFGPPTLRAPSPPGPHPSGPPPLRAPTPPGPHPFRPPPFRPPPKTKLAKCGLAKFGQQKLAKFGQTRMAKCGQLTLAKCGFGQIRFGQMRPNKDGQIRFGQIRPRPILVLPRIQPFGSDEFSSLGKVYSRHATDSVNCENSSVSFVMKYCPTSTVVRNLASVQILNHTILL